MKQFFNSLFSFMHVKQSIIKCYFIGLVRDFKRPVKGFVKICVRGSKLLYDDADSNSGLACENRNSFSLLDTQADVSIEARSSVS